MKKILSFNFRIVRLTSWPIRRWVASINLILIVLSLTLVCLWLLPSLAQANRNMDTGGGQPNTYYHTVKEATWANQPSPLSIFGGQSDNSLLLRRQVPAVNAFVDVDFVGGWTSDETSDTFSIAWADMDGDGDLDLAVSNGSVLQGQVNQVYRNDGKGDFSLAWQSTGDAKTTYSVVWGDYDGDGDPDLAFGNDNAVNQVYRNEGGGNFTLAWESTGDTKQTREVAWGDYDGDGLLDLAIGNMDQVNQIYRNEGGEQFTLAWQSTDMLNTQGVASADMDRDGDLDLVFTNLAEVNQVYQNEGGMSFTLLWESTNDRKDTTSAAWADYNQDGYLDLAFGNGSLFGQQVNQVYRNESGKRFTLAWQSTNDAKATNSVAWGDIDSDGDPDLAIGNNRDVNQVYQNNGVGFTLIWESTGDTKESFGVAWADIDADGDLDFAVGNAQQINQTYRNEGGLGFNTAWSSPDSSNTQSIAWGDMDGDGDLDLAVGNYNGQINQVYRHDSNGNFTLAWESVGDGKDTQSIAWGDMDGDGDLDLAIGNSGLGLGQVNQIYRNNGGESFTLVWESTGDLKDTTSVAWGDMDADGDLDLAVGNGALLGQANQVYRNDGGQVFTLAWESTGDLKDTASVAWGDMDADGDLDLAIGNRSFLDGEVNQVYRNDGGSFTLAWESTGDSKWTESVAWGDYDGDGYLDLAFGNTLQVNQVYRNENGRSFTLGWESTGDSKQTSDVAWADMEGDSDLDLAVSNFGQVNQIYRNDEGRFTLAWESTSDSEDTLVVAWGDMEGDGDLDLAFGNTSQVNQVLENPRHGENTLPNNAPYLSVTRPDSMANANFNASPEILKSSTISLTYTLFDHESDPIRFIRAYYSPNGGGQWLPATPAAGTETTNLATSPMGTKHTFIWDAAADVIKNDHLAFRIEAHQSFSGPDPYQRAALSAQTFPFRVEAAEWYAKVVDETEQALEGAQVYIDGQAITSNEQTPDQSDRAGLIRLTDPTPGQPLVALFQVQEQPTARQAHDGWGYRTYLTNITWDANDEPQPFFIGSSGEQRLMVRRNSPLILFNIVVSIEWNADEAYLATIEEAFRKASDYLYDVTDGQMAFGQVKIYDNSKYWSHADFQISTKNTVRPYAFIGGITSDDTAHSIRVGRFWSGDSGNSGDWDQPAGYRTLIHEFGHYALYLYDEYFVRNLDGTVEDCDKPECPAACTGLEVVGDDDSPTNASIMYYQYNTSELADSDRWTVNCQNTEQARVNKEPDWQTILRKYSGPSWELNTPSSRGYVMPGPESFPNHLLPFPTIDSDDTPGGPPLELTVLGPDNRPVQNALVALYTRPISYIVVIDQGLTDKQGQITIYGAVKGDIIQVTSFDGALAGAAIVDKRLSYVLPLTSTRQSSLPRGTTSPYLDLVPSTEGDALSLKVSGISGGIPLDAIVIPAEGAGTPQSTPLAFSSTEGAYIGQVSFAGVGLGSGEVRVSNIPSRAAINGNYNLFQVLNAQENELASEDGNMQWHINTNSLLNDADAYAIIFPTGYIPGPLPAGKQPVGTAYGIRFSGAAPELSKPGLLTMHYHPEVMGHPTNLAIYRWDPTTENWVLIGGEVSEAENAITAAVTEFGIYTLGGHFETNPQFIWLPVIIK